jgi:micrococcal nuclease
MEFSTKDPGIIPIFDGNRWNIGDKLSIKVQVATAYDKTMTQPFPMPFYIDLGESEIVEYRLIEPTNTSCTGSALCFTGDVEKIVDGDTLDIDGKRIRLSLTNTPERGDEGFTEATEFTRFLCPVGSKAQVDQDDLQPYYNYSVVGKVTCSGKVLNSELLENSHAEILTQYCSKSEFSSEPWAIKFGWYCG